MSDDITYSANGNVSPAPNFNPTAQAIATAALRKIGVIDESEQPAPDMLADTIFALNSLIKEWQATGIHIWTETEAILFLQKGQRKYLLGGDTTPDHCADADSWGLNTILTSANTGATSLTLSAPSDRLKGDYFGVVLDSGFAFWSKLKTAPVGNVVQLCAPLPGPASANAFTFGYTSNIVRPLRVPFARRLQYATRGNQADGGIITPLAPMMSRQSYFNLPEPRDPGLVTQAYYNPSRSQGEMYVWNIPQNANYGLRFTYYRPLFDICDVRNTADFPQEWSNALIWNLANEMALEFDVPAQRSLMIQQRAMQKLELVQGWDREPESVYFGRSYDQTRSN